VWYDRGEIEKIGKSKTVIIMTIMTEIIKENHTMITITNMMTHIITKDVESVVFLVTCLTLTEITLREYDLT
jgi:hypothetical protein